MDLVCEYLALLFRSMLIESQVLGNLLALAGVCPFVGSLSDLVGRRYTALLGGVLLCIGTIVATTANTMNTFICEFIWTLAAT